MIERLFVYLLGRNHKSFKLITILQGSCPVKKLDSVNQLGLPYIWQQAIADIAYEHRMNYEVYIESADSIQILIERLRQRHCTQVNGTTLPLVNLAELPLKDMSQAVHFRLGSKPPPANKIALKKLLFTLF